MAPRNEITSAQPPPKAVLQPWKGIEAITGGAWMFLIPTAVSLHKWNCYYH